MNNNNPSIPYDRNRLSKLFDGMRENSPVDCSPSLDEPGVHGQLIKQALRQLDLNSDDVLLDVGCGSGKIALHAAQTCRQVIGIDISRVAVARALHCKEKLAIENAVFDFGSLEEPCSHINLTRYDVNKILILRTLHHLPDEMKRSSLQGLMRLMSRLGRIVIGDMMFFESPDQHRDKWDEVHYDGELTDHPSTPEFLIDCLKEGGAEVQAERLHPLMGIITAYLE